MQKIRKGDQVVILTGRDKNKRGKVISLLDKSRILVEGVNVAKKCQRANPMKGVGGGIIEKVMPIHMSNVGLFNPAINKADKVGFKLLADGRKVRFFKSTNEIVDI